MSNTEIKQISLQSNYPKRQKTSNKKIKTTWKEAIGVLYSLIRKYDLTSVELEHMMIGGTLVGDDTTVVLSFIHEQCPYKMWCNQHWSATHNLVVVVAGAKRMLELKKMPIVFEINVAHQRAEANSN